MLEQSGFVDELKHTRNLSVAEIAAELAVSKAWVIETFPFDRQPKLNQKKMMALYDSQSYLKAHQNIIWLGATGCGKTGLATSFLIQGEQQFHRKFMAKER